MEKTITATEAQRSFSEIVNRVRYANVEFIVKRNGEPVCKIVPIEAGRKGTVADFIAWAQNHEPDPEFADDLEWVMQNQPPMPDGDPWS